MKTILTAIIFFTLFNVNAQEKGINFQNNLTWAQIKEKAKKEKKYIFVDCYTTWCVPCKIMAKEILPQPAVAAFFNDKFISVALQFDETKSDDATTKRWFKEVKLIEAEAKVDAYPTYLFYNPDGQLVHTIVGGSSNAETFLAKAKQSMDPEMQIRSLRKQYDNGNRSPEFLHIFANTLLQGWDSQAKVVINQYLATQTDLLTKENVSFIFIATEKSTDPGFKVLVNNSEDFDKIAGVGSSRIILGNVVFDEIVLPIVRVNGTKESKGGMFFYKGEINKNVKWEEVHDKIAAKYPALADEILAKSKVTYYRDLSDWPKFTEQAAAYIKQYGKDNTKQVMTYANDIMVFADDKACLSQAADWSKEIVTTSDGASNSWYITVYASLLYKLNRKDEALSIINNAVIKFGDNAYGLKDTQEKMKKGEPL